MKISSTILTAIFVGTAGVIAGTLFAPGKGSKLRNRISKKGQEYKVDMQSNFNDFGEYVSHPFDSLEDETIRMGKKAKKITKKVKQEFNK